MKETEIKGSVRQQSNSDNERDDHPLRFEVYLFDQIVEKKNREYT